VYSAIDSASTMFCVEPGSGFIISSQDWQNFCGKFPGGLIFFMNEHMV